ncbi:hypothetical protein EDC14_102560 [Hydrogenispora ethanolica]|uniref:Uncharacterized protein n=1 Tax=Hydrogenispora ethanolica TaxID=1082276 RepID=A0A4R1R9P8_HYDET|nr:hypothetical protein EDC14_102560 [Hydrogenispora ethanolica]
MRGTAASSVRNVAAVLFSSESLPLDAIFHRIPRERTGRASESGRLASPEAADCTERERPTRALHVSFLPSTRAKVARGRMAAAPPGAAVAPSRVTDVWIRGSIAPARAYNARMYAGAAPVRAVQAVPGAAGTRIRGGVAHVLSSRGWRGKSGRLQDNADRIVETQGQTGAEQEDERVNQAFIHHASPMSALLERPGR